MVHTTIVFHLDYRLALYMELHLKTIRNLQVTSKPKCALTVSKTHITGLALASIHLEVQLKMLGLL